MQRLNKLVHAAIIRPLLQVYLRTEPRTTFDGFKLRIRKGVFHPKLFFSTGYLYSFINSLDLHGKSFLELGCGSGLISLLALRKGARVTCIDLNQNAVNNTAENIKLNFPSGCASTVFCSDVFGSVQPGQKFDVIAINPPYYFREPESAAALAWYCGQNGEYFEKLFGGLKEHTHPGSLVYMILEENCEIEKIGNIAGDHGVRLVLAEKKKFKWETSYIFLLQV